MMRELIRERFDNLTRRLGFVVRTVKADQRAQRQAFEYGKEAERNFGHLPMPKGQRATSTGRRLSVV